MVALRGVPQVQLRTLMFVPRYYLFPFARHLGCHFESGIIHSNMLESRCGWRDDIVGKHHQIYVIVAILGEL